VCASVAPTARPSVCAEAPCVGWRLPPAVSDREWGRGLLGAYGCFSKQVPGCVWGRALFDACGCIPGGHKIWCGSGTEAEALLCGSEVPAGLWYEARVVCPGLGSGNDAKRGSEGV
jgi:hypothetical protein